MRHDGGTFRNEAFVGREDQLAELVAGWRTAKGGAGRFVVLGGDAGVGKTRLAERLAEVIGGEGRVAWGACAGAVAPPLWPWRAVLRDLDREPTAIDAGEGSVLGNPAADQARQVAWLVDELRAATRDGPVLVVLDDLHWADADSVVVLRLVAPEVRRLPVLLVATIRLDELVAGSPLREALTDLAACTDVVNLEGLPAEAVGLLVESLTGRSPIPEIARAVTERTSGNPFFVRELLRLLVAEGTLDDVLAGGDVGVPMLVREVLLRRVAQLSAPAREVLAAAAVAGRSVARAVVERVVDLVPHDVQRGLDEAVAARVVRVEGADVRFTHDLLREALVGAIGAVQRRRLHLAVAEALRATEPGSSAATIAEHLLAALPEGSAETAAAAALEAGRAALAHHAPTDAVDHLQRGLAAIGARPSALRGDLLATLGDAHTRTGDRAAAREAYRSGADVARSIVDVELLARTALGFAGMMGTPKTDPEEVALLEEALVALAGREDAVTAMVEARLAHALLFDRDRRRRLDLADNALMRARAIGDDRAVATALYVWNIVHITSANYEKRLAIAEELLALGRRSRDADAEAWALHFHAHHMAEGGDFAAFDADVAAGHALAEGIGTATWRWTALVHRAMRAAMHGRFAEAEALGNAAFELGQSSQHRLAVAVFGAHLMVLRTWQGRLDELLPMINAGAGRYPELPAVWASIPFAHAEIGRTEEAAEQLSRVMSDRVLDDLPGAQSWTVALAMLARSAQLTGHSEAARVVRRLLDPLGDRHIVGPFADCYYGPAALYAGLCAATAGELDEAASHLERARQQAQAVGARPVTAWASAELADVLARAGRDARRVDELRASAAAEFATLGMHRHLARLTSPAPAVAPNVWRRSADGWYVEFEGRAVTLGHAKGLADLQRLLSAPGVELHVLELAGAGGGSMPALSKQPVLDERAKAEYRQRVLDLEHEVDDANACHDPVRAERAEAERARVVSELAAALGFGGRDRSIADATERARQAVRARIRYSLDKFAAVHPALCEHLRRALSTGTFCCYRPERDTPWTTN